MATVEGLPGVIATGKSIEECQEDLIEVIEEWITMRLQRDLDIPALDGHTIVLTAGADGCCLELLPFRIEC